ncbi:SGNH hydrolase [Deinococcus metallilatus]|uniref:SGNH hydrolase n=2 Tax=Deinococcus metallilatus TaxID=1211322 RepID=A0AAJ5K3N8_9DEIO|nr:SGNH hydrolase [Deinococcus metallilatus]RXJ09208.1 SGNH hydrolase [Deinococcus metallilatus]TLK22817.1 SGNH hydrolase [Deinococcus metallilatus]
MVSGCSATEPIADNPKPPPPAPVAPAAPVAVRIMPLGDSITDGYNIPGGYRTGLFQKLSAAGLPFDFVGSLLNGPAALPDRDHEGHSGWRIDELAAQVNTWLDQQQPATTLLMIGTNDIIQNRDPANAPKRLGALLDQMSARRPGMLILVATLPPLAEAGQNRWVGQYNAALPEVVRSRAAQGQKVTLVDVNAALSVADLADGVHPNSTGYSKLANVWYQALRSTPGALSP